MLWKTLKTMILCSISSSFTTAETSKTVGWSHDCPISSANIDSQLPTISLLSTSMMSNLHRTSSETICQVSSDVWLLCNLFTGIAVFSKYKAILTSRNQQTTGELFDASDQGAAYTWICSDCRHFYWTVLNFYKSKTTVSIEIQPVPSFLSVLESLHRTEVTVPHTQYSNPLELHRVSDSSQVLPSTDPCSHVHNDQPSQWNRCHTWHVNE